MPITFTQPERQSLLNVLGDGRQNAITAFNLAQTLGYPTGGNQVKLRTLIRECIDHDGDLIGAATGRPAGFFIISTLAELNNYLDTLESRIRSDNDRRDALIMHWNNANPHTHTNKQSLTIINT